MSSGNFDNDNDLIMGGTDEASAYNVPASLLQTFPCLMAEGREALRQQLEFITSAVLLHPAEQGPGIDNARAIMDRSKLINDLLTTLYQTAQNLCSLDQVNLDEEYRKEIKQVGDMLQETHRQICNFRLLTNQPAIQQWDPLRAQNMPANGPALSTVSGVSTASHGIVSNQSGQPSSSDQSRVAVHLSTSCESRESLESRERQRESRRERKRVEKVLRKTNKIIKKGVKGKKKRRSCRHCEKRRERVDEETQLMRHV